MDDCVFRANKLSKQFAEQQVLSNINLELNLGQLLGVIGPNGAGKTTLLECLAGLQFIDGGEFIWNHNRYRSLRDLVFYVPETAIPYPDSNVRASLTFFGRAFGRSSEELAKIAAQLSLDSMFSKRVGQLSKGYRRRLMLAIGLLSTQPVLILDEPFDGLDLRQTLDAMTLLRTITKAGRALLVSIHTLSDAQRICERFLLLNRGQAVGYGTLDELRLQANLSAGSLEDIFLSLT